MAGPIKIPIILENVAKGAAMVGGAASGVMGAAASQGSRVQGLAFGAGGPSEITKGLGQIAKQLPGAGMMEGMTSAFKQGGPIGVITAGVAGMLGFVKQIMESSKVFQTIGGSFFKIFGAMADVFLLPFLPLAMRGMQELLKFMPVISNWGQRIAGWIESFVTSWSEDGIGIAIKRHIGPPMMEAVNKIAQAVSWGRIDEKDFEFNERTKTVQETMQSRINRQDPTLPQGQGGPEDDPGMFGTGGMLWDT